MKRGTLVLFAIAVLVASGCSNQQQATSEQQAALEAQARVNAQAKALAEKEQAEAQARAEAEAKALAEKAQAEALALEQKAQAEALALEQKAQEEANIIDQIKGLLAESQQLLADGKLEDALAKAQAVLGFDPNNADALNLVEIIKAKIAEFAQKKMGDMKNELTNTLGNIGQ